MKILQNKTDHAETKGHSGLFPFFQRKLSINKPNDIYEQEADVVADKVMRMSENEIISPAFFLPSISSIQRKCAHCEQEEKLQRKESSSGEMNVPPQTENYIDSLDGKGRSLSHNEKDFFQPRFGYDFSNVKIHTDTEACESANGLNALAYTHNDNIVFGRNQHHFNTDAGRRLMAHELTHVVQNKRGANKQVRAKDFSSKGRANEDTPAIINAVVVKSNMLQKYAGLDRIKAALLNSENYHVIQKYELEEYGKNVSRGVTWIVPGDSFAETCRM